MFASLCKQGITCQKLRMHKNSEVIPVIGGRCSHTYKCF